MSALYPQVGGVGTDRARRLLPQRWAGAERVPEPPHRRPLRLHLL